MFNCPYFSHSLVSSSFQSVWLFYNGCKYLVGRGDDNFEYYFYLLYSIFVPLQGMFINSLSTHITIFKGLLNCLVYGLTLRRSSLEKFLKCDCFRGGRNSEERETLLSINQINAN